MGVAMPREGGVAERTGEKVAPMVSGMILPLYFATRGLHTDGDSVQGVAAWGMVASEVGLVAGHLVMPSCCLRRLRCDGWGPEEAPCGHHWVDQRVPVPCKRYHKTCLPLGLQKCKNLITLHLGGNNFLGTIPSWISTSLPALEFLRLSSNMFDGIIPHQILQFHHLQILDLSDNKLTGPIPNDFTNFTGIRQEPKSFRDLLGKIYAYDAGTRVVWKYMDHIFSGAMSVIVGIDLSCNSLSQEIPDGLTTLIALRFLNLSGNHLSGSIPKDFENLVRLESLDLSQNQLSGGIPQSFAALKGMSVQNLSYNGLSGRIPTGSQMQTLVDPAIYSHNPGLCGFPLEDCINSSTSKQNEVSQAVDREALWLYCFVAVGFIFGFWLYWGMFLFYSETWRCEFYQYVDNMQVKVTKQIYICMPCFPARDP